MTNQNDSSMEEVIRLLTRQNEIISNINSLFTNSLEKENKEDYRLVTRVSDINISFGSMIFLSIKWLIASIPIGIVIFFMYFILINLLGACTAGRW